MVEFPSLIAAGATAAALSDCSDGDCGWDGVLSGERDAFLRRVHAAPSKLVALRQCHGDVVVTVQAGDAGRGARDRESALADADALITRCPGVPLGINVADCVPLFLAGPQAVGLVHAGREGTFLEIAAKAVQALCVLGAMNPSSVAAVIGPSAGPCCYEVSADIARAWQARGGVVAGRKLDLWATNLRQLLNAGVPAAQISVDGRCTICQPGFHSFRGGADRARNLALIMR